MYQLGIDPTTTSTTAQFGLGQLGATVTSAGTKVFMYVQADGTGITADGYVAVIDGSSFQASMATVTTTAPGTGAGKSVGVARAAFAASAYGWVQVYGAGLVQVSASCAAYTLINSTATAGQLDDDASAGAEVIEGIVLDTARGGSAGTAAGWLSYPTVGRTL
jgi:hypothetical protein